ncbi:hypothetical protein EQ871_14435 [Enterococcus casseliflavus]|uniref:hypothetical protein n=1 Tax=Enterococcus casseliflavus TaxID=37734 RepID=UPI000FFC0C64|nr:hypothetical protein [Enterococcus casseliflavus]RXA60491.1 hypothetical protein EQ871_14435 [Enterococcus casseliflavus]
MISIEQVNKELEARLDKAKKLQNQYKGLSEIETKLRKGNTRFTLHTLTFEGYAYREDMGGRLNEDFGIGGLDSVIQTLLLAEIVKRKQEIEQYFSTAEKELGIE